jgi:hypothetical protein
VSGSVFDVVAGRLVELTDLDGLAGRGTIRLVLKEAGLDAKTVTRSQMETVIDRLLGPALTARGVASADAVCASLRGALAGVADEPQVESPDRVFARLGGQG